MGLVLVSLVTNRVSLEEVCLPSFGVSNCLMNLVTSCMDNENELSLKVIASFSDWRGGVTFADAISSGHHAQYHC